MKQLERICYRKTILTQTVAERCKSYA